MGHVVSELAFVSSAVVEGHLPKSFHFASSKLSFVLDPVLSLSHKPSLPFMMIIFPLPFIDKVSISVNQLPLTLHLPFDPVSEIVGSVVVDVFSSAVTQIVAFLALITVTVCIDLTCLDVWTIL